MRWVYIGLLVWVVVSVVAARFLGALIASGASGVGLDAYDDDDEGDERDWLECDMPYGDVVVAFPGMAQREASARLGRAVEPASGAPDGVTGPYGWIA